jgi:phosphate-selective porin OprO/OprP
LANTIWYDESSDGRGYAHWAISGTWADTDQNGEGAPGSADSEADFRTRAEARTRVRWLDTGEISGGQDYTLLGAEGVVNVGPLQLVGEYQNVWLNRDGGPDLHFHGGYGYVSYMFTGEHIPWDRKSGTIGRVKPFENFFAVDTVNGCSFGTGAWEAAVRFSYLDLSDEDIHGGRGTSVSGAINWYWTPNARLQMNYIVGRIEDSQVSGPSSSDFLTAAPYNSGDYQILGFRWMIDY